MIHGGASGNMSLVPLGRFTPQFFFEMCAHISPNGQQRHHFSRTLPSGLRGILTESRRRGGQGSALELGAGSGQSRDQELEQGERRGGGATAAKPPPWGSIRHELSCARHSLAVPGSGLLDCWSTSEATRDIDANVLVDPRTVSRYTKV